MPSLFPPHRPHPLLWAGQKPLSGRPPGCCGSWVAFKPVSVVPRSLYNYLAPLFALSPSISNKSPRPHQDTAYFPLGLPSRPPPQPARWEPAGTGHWADGQLGRGLLDGTTATHRVLLPAPGECWQWHGVRSTARSRLVAYCTGTVVFASSCSWG